MLELHKGTQCYNQSLLRLFDLSNISHSLWYVSEARNIEYDSLEWSRPHPRTLLNHAPRLEKKAEMQMSADPSLEHLGNRFGLCR